MSFVLNYNEKCRFYYFTPDMPVNAGTNTKGGIKALFSTCKTGYNTGKPAKNPAGLYPFDFKPVPCNDENYSAVSEIFSSNGKIDKIIRLKQEHTDIILNVNEKFLTSAAIAEEISADAAVTAVEGIILSVRTADCVPILLFDPVRGVVAAAHCGWRGTFAELQCKTVDFMCAEYSCNPSHIKAAVGASIRSCCYEVSADFYDMFTGKFGGAHEFFTLTGGKFFCDLAGINKKLLISCGIDENNIDISPHCTHCHPELFYSHRRDKTHRGTMAAFIGICRV